MISWFCNDFLSFLFGMDQKSNRLPLKIVDNKREPVYVLSRSFHLPPSIFGSDGERYALLASSRQGKSYMAGKLIEQMLELFRQLFIFDPQGEYFSLQEHYQILILGGIQENDETRLELTKEKAYQTIDLALKENISVIFDLSALKNDAERCEYFSCIGDYLFECMAKIPKKERFKVTVMVEEVAIFCPQKSQGYTSQSSATAIRFFTLGGKMGIDSIVATQRLAIVDKTIFSQCTCFFFGKVISPQDFKAVSQYTSQYGLLEQHVKDLSENHFYCCFYDPREKKNVAINIKAAQRHCTHGGGTPEFVARQAGSMKEAHKQLKGEQC